MKIKTDFVTNSSSTSFIFSLYKINDEKKLKKYLKEEFGKAGERIFKENVMTGLKAYDYINENSYEGRLSEHCYNKIKEKMFDNEKYLIDIGGGSPPGVMSEICSCLNAKDAGLEDLDMNSYSAYYDG